MNTGIGIGTAFSRGASTFGLSHNHQNQSVPKTKLQNAHKVEPQSTRQGKPQEAAGANSHGPRTSASRETGGTPPFSTQTMSALLRAAEGPGQIRIVSGEGTQGVTPGDQSPGQVVFNDSNVTKPGSRDGGDGDTDNVTAVSVVQRNGAGPNASGPGTFPGHNNADNAAKAYLNGVAFRSGVEPSVDKRAPDPADNPAPKGKATDSRPAGAVTFKIPELTAKDLVGLNLAETLRKISVERTERLELEREKDLQANHASGADHKDTNGKGLAPGDFADKEQLRHFEEFETGLRKRAGTVFRSSGSTPDA